MIDPLAVNVVTGDRAFIPNFTNIPCLFTTLSKKQVPLYRARDVEPSNKAEQKYDMHD